MITLDQYASLFVQYAKTPRLSGEPVIEGLRRLSARCCGSEARFVSEADIVHWVLRAATQAGCWEDLWGSNQLDHLFFPFIGERKKTPFERFIDNTLGVFINLRVRGDDGQVLIEFTPWPEEEKACAD